MLRNLPPLNSLRSFESAARHMSFSLAAAELNVTPGAVSRQVRLLEAFLGHRLFRRGYRKIYLTQHAEAYSASISELFARLEATTNSVFDLKHERPLQIWCPMVFAMRWLLPRLPAFYRKEPKNEVRLTTSVAAAPSASSFGIDSIEAGIRLGNGDWPNLSADRLVPSRLIPVCSPQLLVNGPALVDIGDLGRHTLLCSQMRPGVWDEWLAAAGASGVECTRRMNFESSSLAYQAAIEGLGIALGQCALIADDIRSGRLITPFSFEWRDQRAFYLIYPKHIGEIRRLKTFRDWIVEEAKRDEAS